MLGDLVVRISKLGRVLRDESGASAVEYGLIVSLIVIGIVAALISLGNEVNEDFSEIADQYSEANG